ncbi:MAG: MBL fold metallo-hydrolase [Deltaproteobacteria bacterium]|nr:MBL fold metallo-hydrolase [Deltaproteobacteria bacterium]
MQNWQKNMSKLMNILIAHIMSRLDFQMKPTFTGKITDNLFAIRDRNVNLYVYLTDAGPICFDAGYGGASLEKEFRKIDVMPQALKHIFFTHSDADHARNLSLFPSAKRYLCGDEEQMINGETARFSGVYFNSIDNLGEYTLLADGDAITIGTTTISAIATPGHTPGSMSYLVDDTILITGDTLFLENGKAGEFVESYNMDTPTQRESIRKLAGLDRIRLMCTAHTGFTWNFEEAMQAWRT